jgi:transposase
MMNGVDYDGAKLHTKGYFREFIKTLEADKRLIEMVRLSHDQVEVLSELERRVKRLIYTQPGIRERVVLLTSIPGVGEITALTWILEVWDPHRFSNYKQAISFCGLCAAQRESGGKEVRGPLSKQRNKRLQWVLVEASKIAVHRLKAPELVAIYEKTAAKAHKNAATIAVARELVKWLVAVDKRGTPFEEHPTQYALLLGPPAGVPRRLVIQERIRL